MQKHLVLAAAAGLALVLAPSASAPAADATLTCRGAESLVKPKGNDLKYSFGCNHDITSFTIVASQEVDYFNSRSELVNRSDGAPSELGKAYECQGEIPGDGFSCVGGEQPRSTFATGDFSTTERPCDGISRRTVLRSWVVVQYVEGEADKAKTVTSQPFSLKRAATCPQPNRRRTR